MWFQLQIEHCHRDEVEQLSDVLEESGALSITLTDKNDDPVLEPEPGTTPLWPDVIINALYDDSKLAQRCLQQFSNDYPTLHFSINELMDQDWERAWMDDFKPQRFGTRLWVCPSWMSPPDPSAVNLILDPGLAFGSGTHPTTSLCLSWLEQATLEEKEIIDYGCGSGILGLAALKLGAKAVQALDIDPQALIATENNALNNGINRAQLAINLPKCITGPVDIIIANILLAPLIKLKSIFYDALNPEGLLVISGILSEQANSLREAYEHHFIFHSSAEKEGWALLTFRPRSR